MKTRKDDAVKTGVLLPFPIHGEALLVKLADLLRSHVGDNGPRRDPFLFSVSGRGRLRIDRVAHVDFNPDEAEFRAAIEAVPKTRVILETTDFDALVDFVVQYVAARVAEAKTLGTAA